MLNFIFENWRAGLKFIMLFLNGDRANRSTLVTLFTVFRIIPLFLISIDVLVLPQENNSYLQVVIWDEMNLWSIFLTPFSNCQPTINLKGYSPTKNSKPRWRSMLWWPFVMYKFWLYIHMFEGILFPIKNFRLVVYVINEILTTEIISIFI